MSPNGIASPPLVAGTPSHEPSPRARLAWWVVVLVLAAGYATLRLTMNEEYRVAPWLKLVELRAPLPFGHRVLVPLLARPLLGLGCPLPLALGILETIAAVSLVVAVTWTLRPRVGERVAMVAGPGLILLLPWSYLLPHKWPIFYPWDTPAMALLVLGVGCIVRRRWGLAMLVAAVAALNRESAMLLPVIALLWWPPDGEQRRASLARAAGLVAVVLAVRLGIAMALPDNPGPSLHFTVGAGEYRVLNNLRWLSDPLHLLATLPSLGAWPLAWPLLAGHVDAPWRRLWLVAWATTAGLLLVANAYEPRAFGEVLALAWLPTVVGIRGWLRGEAPHVDEPRPGWLRRLDRHGPWVVVVGFVLFVLALRQWEFLPVSQWPMPKG